jgi:hypothetical protein
LELGTVEILYKNRNISSPEVSIILLDWSCRESFHSLTYLKNQTVERRQYEIIWIEYYNRHSPEIGVGLKEAQEAGQAPIVDQWIVMGMPRNVYFHKHLMYNIGIVSGRGKIITLCDSDAMFTPTFVESIIKSFGEDRNIVLHMDEFRNNDSRFYPFNYPSVEEVVGHGCINWRDGKTTGLLDNVDPLHSRNYGACMAALREDLIDIGGADEHIDYLGHICGPYEMTFRLVNAGKREVWHEKEFLYHVWHPGQAGQGNYLGPHDGRHMSTTALKVRRTGRMLPLVENRGVQMLRFKSDIVASDQIFDRALPRKIEHWEIARVEKRNKSLLKSLWKLSWEVFWKPFKIGNLFMEKPGVALRIADTLLKMLFGGLFEGKKPFKRTLREVYRKYLLITNINKYNDYAINKCKILVRKLVAANIHEVALYGTDDVAGVFYNLITHSPVKINAVYDDSGGERWLGFDILTLDHIKGFNDHVVVPNLVGAERKVELLKGMGLREEQIILI